ncbi:CAF17-like 4Fe-4S cluster assembly/insertion protein YgfZ [Saccharospirillum salsuginis]|uniref:Aminomethyltransferase folate-binding domain-containing protein n=1 Tax=Saccharospirillum salsuginis TaxID=418750 RepID=A0A918KND8_9GAMM|nr:folate-binding protein YgfZ [Saccharospirillum salsuginis]GGX69756.1 hypothetical protein GCM10007392_41690 [Saccharospirillum salsuginis]
MSDTTFYPLDHLSILSIAGSDALSFLQGQGTQDYNRLTSSGPKPGAFCTPKGRVVANVWNLPLASDPAEVKLVISASASEGLQKHLKKYIPFFRGSRLADEHLHYHGLGVVAPNTGEVLDDWFGEGEQGVWQRGGHFAFQLPDGRAQIWLNARADDYEDRLERVEAATVKPNEAWQRLDIEAGYAWVGADHQERFVPQMLNLDHLDGISFKKGCYTGQEVVARLHYKGQSKRGLSRLAWSGNTPPEGPNLFTEKGQGGEWVNWQAGEDGGVGLAVIKDTEHPPRLFLDEGRRVELKVLE